MAVAIDYIERMLEYHPDEPAYRWAAPGELPAPAGPPLTAEDARIVLVSLAGVRLRAQEPFDLRGDTTIRRVPLDADPAELAIDHFGFKVARAAEDPATVAPLATLLDLVADGTIAEVAREAVSAMGATYSQRRVVTELAPAVVEAVRELAAAAPAGPLDVRGAAGPAGPVGPAGPAGPAGLAGPAATPPTPLALIVPACPLDHQTAGLLARAIEAAGIRTLVLSGARDISRHVGAPRTVYLHAPLGWLLGMPGDRSGQRARLAAAVEAGAALPGTGELHDLDPHYPTGAGASAHSSDEPELVDWESREYGPGYDTGATR